MMVKGKGSGKGAGKGVRILGEAGQKGRRGMGRAG